MISLDNLAYNSKLAPVSPGAKLFLGIAPMCIVLSFGDMIVSLICFMFMSIFCIKYSNISFKSYVKLVFIPLSFLLIGAVTIAVVKTGNEKAILSLGNYGITFPSISEALLVVVRSLSCVSCMYFIALSTPMNDIFVVLRKLKTPEIIISLMELIYRYIFVVIEETGRAITAQKARKGDLKLIDSIKVYGELMGNVLIRCMSRSIRVNYAMEARGYKGELYYIDREFKSGKNILLLCLFISVILIGIGLWRM